MCVSSVCVVTPDVARVRYTFYSAILKVNIARTELLRGIPSCQHSFHQKQTHWATIGLLFTLTNPSRRAQGRCDWPLKYLSQNSSENWRLPHGEIAYDDSGRTLPIKAVSADRKLIAHDCVVHHGKSGGPLLSADGDAEGLILGVNSLGYSPLVELQEQSKEGGIAVAAASISEFLALQDTRQQRQLGGPLH